MRLLTNRIVISIVVIVVVAAIWEFSVRPASGPVYLEAVEQYDRGNYERSLELLNKAYLIEPNDTASLTLIGWNYHKLGRFAEAEPYFTRALRLNPTLVEPRLGLAHCWVELGEPEKALEHFEQLPPEERASLDVQVGMARAYRMVGENTRALELLARVQRQDPENELAAKEMSALIGAGGLETVAVRQLAPLARPEELQLAARLRNGYFEVPTADGWTRHYVAGVNIGPATPGHFPSEPPTDFDTYMEWLKQIGELGGNTIRVYTLLPPAFYRALLVYNNRNPEAPVYLLQEIWLKESPTNNLFDAKFTTDFEASIREVVDVVHGQANLPVEPGRVGGIFAADVSPYVLGWLVGREIEPHVVVATNVQNPRAKSFVGRYLKIDQGNASEVWLTQRCEAVVAYEVEKYNWQRPVSIVNWPPLDPLSHPTESGMQEEWRIRRARGEVLPPLRPALYDDNDAVSIDEEKIDAQPEFQAGYFATYHLYPFYPDFILHDPNYRVARDNEGINSYWGYLQDLKRHFRKTPVLVGEYGLSTSVGIAHFNPNGWNHGGLEEAQQGQALVRLTRNIEDVGFAGGLVFAWIDEWWKHNWIAADFEKPFERTALWHNDMDPEQYFGLQKFVPRQPLAFREILGGAALAAEAVAAFPRIRSVKLATDPAALYVNLELDAAGRTEIDWEKGTYYLALNTCGRPCGSSQLPFEGLSEIREGNGFNFVVRIDGPPRATLLVAGNYNPYRELGVSGLPRLSDIGHLRGQVSTLAESSDFEEIVVETNRRRYGRDGTYFPAERYSRSLLLYGVFDPEAADYNSVAQWYYDAEAATIRLRLSWGLLLVMDPSSGFVFWSTDQDARPAGVRSEQIGLAAFAYSPASSLQILPQGQPPGSLAHVIPWPGWQRIEVKQVPKKSYHILRPEFERLTGRGQERR